MTYDFYREYDLDFIKTMNNGMYGVECFGCKIDYSDIEKEASLNNLHSHM